MPIDIINISIALFLTVLGAILGAIFSHYHIAFHVSPKKIRYKGVAHDITALSGKVKDHNTDKLVKFDFGRDFGRREFVSYRFEDITLFIRGKKVKLKGKMEVIDYNGKEWMVNLNAIGSYISGGSLHDGFCYLETSLTKEDVNWKAIYILRINVTKDIDGYWITEDTINRGSFVFGRLQLEPLNK